ncbi:MAG: ferrous iron transport protein B [Anaeromassilibacillus sp.]
MQEKQNSIRVLLAGNPNCGKTTLFNRLTGDNQYVGNWPGVTVEKRTGQCLTGDRLLMITDLPGVYSLYPYSPEEAIADRFLHEKEAEVVVDVVDATNPERNLYLTMQLLERKLPVIVALNMMDELQKHGDRVDCGILEKVLGVPVVPISAATGLGMDSLLSEILRYADQPQAQTACPYILPSPDIPDYDVLLAKKRYDAAESAVKQGFWRAPRPEKSLSDRIDALATHRLLAIPLFFLLLTVIFVLTFGSVGSFLSNGLSKGFDVCSAWMERMLLSAGTSDWVRSLVMDGIFSGLSAVATFLPQIILLFFLLSLLEDSGYMARAAFIMDAPMRKLGLSGKAFVPLLMGFGCTVPAVMGTRILEQQKDRRLTILTLPFMSCSAKMPVYALFIAAFFADYGPWAILAIYLLGVVLGALSALFFKSTVLRGEYAPFVMELPPYRLPTWKSLRIHVWERVKDFFLRAGTILLCATILVWFLRSFSPQFQYVTDQSQSILAVIGKTIAPAFQLCGFADWRACVSLLTGLVAKESVVSTMGILYGGEMELSCALAAAFTPLSACSFLLFVLLYTPCVAALSAIYREMKSIRWTAVCVIWQLCVAWYTSALFYQTASLLTKFFCT